MTARTYGDSGEALDVLAIAPHPDDAEIGCGGTLLVAAKQGKRTGVLELTRGELGTLGTPEERDAEAITAAGILGLAYRFSRILGATVHAASSTRFFNNSNEPRPYI